MARAIVRGIHPDWIRSAYSFAIKPDVVFYLRIGVDDLITRVVFSRGFDYWESGMDLYPSEDMYEAFRKYETHLLAEFDRLAEEYEFEVVDAAADIHTVYERLRAGIMRILGAEPREPQLVATRTIAVSPFPEDQGKALYFGGYDCNGVPSHNTAWIYKGTIKEKP